MTTYRLTTHGRRTTIILLVSAFAIWGFALWSFRSTLNIRYDPRVFVSTLSAAFDNGLTISHIVPALLMLVLIVATPLLVWNLLEEWAACYTPTDDGLRFESFAGIALTIPWDAIQTVRRVDDDSDEPLDVLIINGNQAHQIKNPIVRFLHCQAYGNNTLPIYAGLEERDQLLADIHQYVAQQTQTALQPPAVLPPHTTLHTH